MATIMETNRGRHINSLIANRSSNPAGRIFS